MQRQVARISFRDKDTCKWVEAPYVITKTMDLPREYWFERDPLKLGRFISDLGMADPISLREAQNMLIEGVPPSMDGTYHVNMTPDDFWEEERAYRQRQREQRQFYGIPAPAVNS